MRVDVVDVVGLYRIDSEVPPATARPVLHDASEPTAIREMSHSDVMPVLMDGDGLCLGLAVAIGVGSIYCYRNIEDSAVTKGV